MWKNILSFLFCSVQRHTRVVGVATLGRWAWSRRAAVVSPCSQVQLVAVVMEHQQAVEVLAHFEGAVLVSPPTHGAVGEAVNGQGRPGGGAGLLQVMPADREAQVTGRSPEDSQCGCRPGRADLICWMSLWMS